MSARVLGPGYSWVELDLESEGGSGTPGGDPGELQYNQAGAFGGIAGSSWDGSYASLPNLAIANGTIPPADFSLNGQELVFAPIVSSGTVTNVLSDANPFTLAVGSLLEIVDAHGAQDASNAQVIGLRIITRDGQVNSGNAPAEIDALRATATQDFNQLPSYLTGIYAEAFISKGQTYGLTGTFSVAGIKAGGVTSADYIFAYDSVLQVRDITVPVAYGYHVSAPSVFAAGAVTEGGGIQIGQQTNAGILTAYTINASASTAPSVFGGSITASDFILSGSSQTIHGSEVSEPAAPAANGFKIFAKDTGGKTQLLVRFASGASQVIATEP